MTADGEGGRPGHPAADGAGADDWYVRDSRVAVVTRGQSCLLIRPDRQPLVISPVDAGAVASLLGALVEPMPADALAERADDDLIAFWVEEGVLRRGARATLDPDNRGDEPSGPRPCGLLVWVLTGAIGTVQVAPYLFDLSRRFCDALAVVLTPAARRLLTPAFFEHVGISVIADEAAADDAARRADLVVVMPASAHTIYKLAHGAGSDLASGLVAGTRAPVVIVPSMNAAMWENPAIIRNIDKLRKDGGYVVEPRLGREVSAQDGEGLGIGGVGIPLSGLELALVSLLAVHRDGDMP